MGPFSGRNHWLKTSKKYEIKFEHSLLWRFEYWVWGVSNHLLHQEPGVFPCGASWLGVLLFQGSWTYHRDHHGRHVHRVHRVHHDHHDHQPNRHHNHEPLVDRGEYHGSTGASKEQLQCVLAVANKIGVQISSSDDKGMMPSDTGRLLATTSIGSKIRTALALASLVVGGWNWPFWKRKVVGGE